MKLLPCLGAIGALMMLASVVNAVTTKSLGAPAQRIDSELQSYLKKYGLPALSVAVVKDGQVIASGAAGSRSVRREIPVTLDDKFHIGSDTKAMTAMIAAGLVEEGKLNWKSTPSEIFPELAGQMDRRFRKITLDQLLSHTSGLPSDNAEFVKLLEEANNQEANLKDQRYWLVKKQSSRPLQAEPGTRFSYSNFGYTLVGAMIEKVTGKPWDDLIRERVFKPLDLKTAGLGCQATLGEIDAPLGHVKESGKTQEFLAGPACDNPPVIGPAGIAHMSVLDFAKWAAWNAAEGKSAPALLKPETIKRLHSPVISVTRPDAPPGTPPSGQYARGWGVLAPDWASHPLIYHGGSNEKNLAHIWLDPRSDFAMVIMTNIGGPQAEDGLKALAPELYKRFASRPSS